MPAPGRKLYGLSSSDHELEKVKLQNLDGMTVCSRTSESTRNHSKRDCVEISNFEDIRAIYEYIYLAAPQPSTLKSEPSVGLTRESIRR